MSVPVPLAVTGTGYVGGLRAELLKTAKRWSPWVLLMLNLAILLGLSDLLVWVLAVHPFPGEHLSAAMKKGLQASVHPGGFAHQALGGSGLTPILALLLGALLMGTDFGSGALKTLLTLRPGRLEALAAKLSALAIALAVGMVVVFAMSALASLLLAALDGASLSSWPSAAEIVKAMLAAWLIWGWWALFGATLAILFQNMALAIGIGLAYQVVLEGLLLNLGSSLGGTFFVDLKRAFPGPNAGWIQDAFPVHEVGVAASTTVASGANSAGVATLILAGWCLVALIVSGVLVALRDVT